MTLSKRLPEHRQIEPRQRLLIWCAVSKPQQVKQRNRATGEVVDKVSLNDQEALGRAFAAEHNMDIVKVLIWPGHSRDESDLFTAFDEFAKAGFYQYHELREMIHARAFDVLWCHTLTRLGRGFTLQSFVIENVYRRANARIYAHIGGWTDPEQYPTAIALNGWANATDRERKVSQTDSGLNARAERGLNLAGVGFPHRGERNPDTGEIVRIVLDERHRPFLNEMIHLLQEKVGWEAIPARLAERGFLNPKSGKPFSYTVLHQMFYRASFWGNIARYHYSRQRQLQTNDADKSDTDPTFVFDASVPPPPGVIMLWDKFEAAYTGEQARLVQSLLRQKRRYKGGARPYMTHALSGLFVCAECNHIMRLQHASAFTGHYYVKCDTGIKHRSKGIEDNCSVTRAMRAEKAFAHVSKYVLAAAAHEDLSGFFGQAQNEFDIDAEIKRVRTDLTRQEQTIRRLIIQAAEADETLGDYYRKVQAEHATTLAATKSRLIALEAEQARQQRSPQEQRDAVEKLRPLAEEDGWSAFPGHEVNRWLKDFMMDYRFFVLDGEIIGIRQHTSLHITRNQRRSQQDDRVS